MESLSTISFQQLVFKLYLFVVSLFAYLIEKLHEDTCTHTYIRKYNDSRPH